jgi:hypothetical protein
MFSGSLQTTLIIRKNWEPYEQLGVNELDPGELEELLQFPGNNSGRRSVS